MGKSVKRTVRFADDWMTQSECQSPAKISSKSVNTSLKRIEKYDLEELFENTPVFQYPPLKFNEKDLDAWKKLQLAISSPFRDDQERLIKYVTKMKEQLKSDKKEDIQKYIKELTHKFPFYFVKLTSSQVNALMSKETLMEQGRLKKLTQMTGVRKQKSSYRQLPRFTRQNYSTDFRDMSNRVLGSNIPPKIYNESHAKVIQATQIQNTEANPYKPAKKTMIKFNFGELGPAGGGFGGISAPSGFDIFPIGPPTSSDIPKFQASGFRSAQVSTPVQRNQYSQFKPVEQKRTSILVNREKDQGDPDNYDILSERYIEEGATPISQNTSRSKYKNSSNNLGNYGFQAMLAQAQKGSQRNVLQKENSMQEKSSSSSEELVLNSFIREPTKKNDDNDVIFEDILNEDNKISKGIASYFRKPSDQPSSSPYQRKKSIRKSTTSNNSPVHRMSYSPFNHNQSHFQQDNQKKPLQAIINEFAMARLSASSGYRNEGESQNRDSIIKIQKYKRIIKNCRRQSLSTLIGPLKQSHECQVKLQPMNSVQIGEKMNNPQSSTMSYFGKSTGEGTNDRIDQQSVVMSKLNSLYLNKEIFSSHQGSAMKLQWRSETPGTGNNPISFSNMTQINKQKQVVDKRLFSSQTQIRNKQKATTSVSGSQQLQQRPQLDQL